MVELKNVTFAYPKNRQQKVLNRVNMKFELKNVAIMGESGSGKSTLLQLLLRLYDADEGTIFLDGHDIKELDLEWYR